MFEKQWRHAVSWIFLILSLYPFSSIFKVKILFSWSNKRRETRDCANYCTIRLIPHASMVLQRIISKFKLFLLPLRNKQVSCLAEKWEILNSREIIEEHCEFSTYAVQCFVDYAKTFDWVRWKKYTKFSEKWNNRYIWWILSDCCENQTRISNFSYRVWNETEVHPVSTTIQHLWRMRNEIGSRRSEM